MLTGAVGQLARHHRLLLVAQSARDRVPRLAVRTRLRATLLHALVVGGGEVRRGKMFLYTLTRGGPEGQETRDALLHAGGGEQAG